MYKAVHRTADPDVFESRGGTLWRVGCTKVLPEDCVPPLVGRRGFHACACKGAPFTKNFGFGFTFPEDALLEVELSGARDTDGVTTAATTCTVIRVVPDSEVHDALQTLSVLRFSANGGTYRIRHGGLHYDVDAEPAVEITLANGGKIEEWYRHGVLHRAVGLPARVHLNAAGVITRFEYFNKGVRERADDCSKPAIICSGGVRLWYRGGVLHREGGLPAVEDDARKRRAWYLHGVQQQKGK